MILNATLSDLNFEEINDILMYTNETSEYHTLHIYRHLFLNIKICLLLALIGVGLLGNSISVIVFSKKNMRRVSTFRYLLYLSLVDLLVLIVSATHLLLKLLFKIDVRLYSSFTCKSHTFLTYFFSHMCSMILIAVNVDRVLKMKNIRELESKKSPNNFTKEIIEKNRIDIDLTEENRIEELNFNIESNKRDKRMSIRVKFSRRNQQLKFETIESGKHFTYSSIIIEQEKSKCSRYGSFIKKHITVDFIMFVICLSLVLLNLHFIIFLKFEVVEVEEMSFLRSEEFKNLSINHFSNETFYVERCDAERDTPYETFVNTIWFWIDMSTFSFIPLIFMCVCSMMLFVEFRSLNLNYFRLIANESYELNKENYMKKVRRNRQICMILFKSSFYFCFIMLEYWLNFFFFKQSDYSNEWLKELHSLSYLFLYTNNVFNFFIYGLNSEKYRRELHSLFTRNGAKA